MATELPASGYLENASRNNAEMKIAIPVIRDVVSNMLGGDGSYELTIASSAVTPPARDHGGFFRIDSEGNAASDDLATITLTNVPDGAIFRLRAEDAARVITLKHAAGGSGQMLLKDGVDFVFASENSWVEFQVQSTDCVEMQRYVPITDLTALTAPDTADLVRVYDNSATTEKKISAALLGRIVQAPVEVAYTGTTAVTNQIPHDNSIPEITEGTEILSGSITPTKSTHRLRFTVEVIGAPGSAANWVAALFQSGVTNSLAARGNNANTADQIGIVNFSHEQAAGSTSSLTFSVRVGAASGNFYPNGISSGRRLGGVSACRLRIEEIAA